LQICHPVYVLRNTLVLRSLQAGTCRAHASIGHAMLKSVFGYGLPIAGLA